MYYRICYADAIFSNGVGVDEEKVYDVKVYSNKYK